MRKIILLFVAGFMCTACATTGNVTNINSPCAPNFTIEGSFWSGKTFKSFKEFPNANKDKAFENILASIAANGWQIVSSNKESGIVSASQGVTMGQGKTVPLNVVIRNGKNGGIRIDVSFSISGGLATSDDAVVSEFCKILDAV